MIPRLIAAAVATALVAKFAGRPGTDHVLFYKKRYPLHGVVPPNVVAHLCDVRAILDNDPALNRGFIRTRFEEVVGAVRAFYMAILKQEKHAVVKTIGLTAQERLSEFECFVAYSFFIRDLMGSLAFVSDEITETLLKLNPSASARSH